MGKRIFSLIVMLLGGAIMCVNIASAEQRLMVFHYWDPERIEAIPLKKSEISPIGYIPIAISKFTQKRELAQRFIDFLLSEEG